MARVKKQIRDFASLIVVLLGLVAVLKVAVLDIGDLVRRVIREGHLIVRELSAQPAGEAHQAYGVPLVPLDSGYYYEFVDLSSVLSWKF